MNSDDQRRLAEDIYQFFSSHYVNGEVDAVEVADVAFVFGRYDATFAKVATALYHDDAVKKVLVTGGIGKDSGDLTNLKIPEAHFLASIMLEEGVQGDDLLVEPFATNGAANSKLGTEMIVAAGITAKRIVLVGHPATLLRLSAVHTRIARSLGFEAGYQLFAVDTDFVLGREKDQKTIIGECWRLWDYPQSTAQHAEPWADPISIPLDLVERVLAWKAAQPK